jgi:hypothetical protein
MADYKLLRLSATLVLTGEVGLNYPLTVDL